MKQTEVLDNACGVIACIHSTLNNLDKFQLAEGSILSKYHESVKGSSPQERAHALEVNVEFQDAHKASAAQGQSDQAVIQADVRHHFIAFTINQKGQLIELDGQKEGPLVVKE